MRTIRQGDVALLERTIFNMTNQTPTIERVDRIEDLRMVAKQLAAAVYVNCPKSRERSLALTNLEDALMWAVASIAREGWDERDFEGDFDAATS